MDTPTKTLTFETRLDLIHEQDAALCHYAELWNQVKFRWFANLQKPKAQQLNRTQFMHEMGMALRDYQYYTKLQHWYQLLEKSLDFLSGWRHFRRVNRVSYSIKAHLDGRPCMIRLDSGKRSPALRAPCAVGIRLFKP